VTNNLRVMQL